MRKEKSAIKWSTIERNKVKGIEPPKDAEFWPNISFIVAQNDHLSTIQHEIKDLLDQLSAAGFPVFHETDAASETGITVYGLCENHFVGLDWAHLSKDDSTILTSMYHENMFYQAWEKLEPQIAELGWKGTCYIPDGDALGRIELKDSHGCTVNYETTNPETIRKVREAISRGTLQS